VSHRIGDLRRRLVLETEVRADDGAGGAIRSWTPVATIAAAVIGRSGRETVDADAVSGIVTHEIWIRHRPGLVPGQRLRADARVFHILAVVEADTRGRRLRCLCEERRL
jgi:SPP1 family predicted phage head-tail adaptor